MRSCINLLCFFLLNRRLLAVLDETRSEQNLRDEDWKKAKAATCAEGMLVHLEDRGVMIPENSCQVRIQYPQESTDKLAWLLFLFE